MNQELKEREIEITNTITDNETHFWRDNIMDRTTNTGMSKNVTSQYASNTGKNKIVEDIKLKNIPYTDGRKFIPKDKFEKNAYFTNLVNEALDDIWHGKKGFCFSTDQLKEIIKICPDVSVKYNYTDDQWCCWLVQSE